MCVVCAMPFSLQCTLAARAGWGGGLPRGQVLNATNSRIQLLAHRVVCLYCMGECGGKMGLLGWVNIDSLCLNRDSPVTFESYFKSGALAVNCLSIKNTGTEVLCVFHVISVKCVFQTC